MGQVQRPGARWLPFVLLALVAGGIEACSAITGLSNVSRDDGVVSSETDASVSGGEAGTGLGGTQYSDGGLVTYVDGDTPVSNCTPDPTWCENRCGDVTDNCNEIRHCSSDCGTNNTCDPTTHQCSCQPITGLCDLKCDTITSNCNTTLDCGDCPTDGGAPLTCTSNACGCMPDPVSTTCNALNLKCGTAVNNCKQTVLCGNFGACPNGGDVCQAGGVCCTPNNAAVCAGKCGGEVVTNSCGQQIACPATCPSGQVCTGTTCCTPTNNACAGKNCGTAVNECGQTISCGACTAPYTCGSNDVCSCTPTTACSASTCNATTDGCGNTLNCAGFCADYCPNGGSCLASGICHCIVTQPCNELRDQAIANGVAPEMLPICPNPN